MTKSLMKIFTNYVPSKYKSFDDQDPTWMNDRIKSTIQQKNSLFKQYVKNSKTAHNYQSLQVAIRVLSYHITERKSIKSIKCNDILDYSENLLHW